MPGITSLPPRNRAVTQLAHLQRARLPPGHPRDSSAFAFNQGDFKHPFSPKDLNIPKPRCPRHLVLLPHCFPSNPLLHAPGIAGSAGIYPTDKFGPRGCPAPGTDRHPVTAGTGSLPSSPARTALWEVKHTPQPVPLQREISWQRGFFAAGP